MTITQQQLEWIVREVVRRLAIELRRPQPSNPHEAPRPHEAEVPTPSHSLVLDGPVLATEMLRGRLRGVAQLRVPLRTIVTPAARDLLRDEGVELMRVGSDRGVAGSR